MGRGLLGARKGRRSGALNSDARLTEVADQEDVAGIFAFGQEQLFAVARPGEIEDLARSEVRYGARRAAAERLFPYVGGAVAGQEVLQTLLIG